MNCVVCKRTLYADDKTITVTFKEPKRTRYNGKCHIARKCTDKLPFTASERAEMDRVISMALEEQS